MLAMNKIITGVGRGGAGGANAPSLLIMGGIPPLPTFLEIVVLGQWHTVLSVDWINMYNDRETLNNCMLLHKDLINR